MRTLPFLLAASFALPVVTAQIQLITPPGYGTLEGASNNAFPWNRGAASQRYQQLYDSTNFTTQGVTGPVLITELKFRANATTASWSGGTTPNVQIDMSTATVDHASFNTTFDLNHGPDRTTVLTGPVVVQPGIGNGNGVPGPWHIHIVFSQPFLYDPTTGNDLVMDVMLDGTGWTGQSVQADADSNVLCSRLWNSGNHLATTSNGSSANYGLITEFTYAPPAGYASSTAYGQGCYASASSFYETFPPNSFDLSNTAMLMVPTASGYVVVPTAPNFVTPTTANLGLANDAVSTARTLPFTFPYPGGSTTSLYVSSNGFVWTQSNTAAGCCFSSASQLLAQAARFAPLWADFDPSSGGTVHFHLDATNTIAYVTWRNVPEAGQTNSNSVQAAFYSDGRVEYQYQACAIASHTALVGWSPGGGRRDPGGVDLSLQLPVTTGPDIYPLSLGASTRPVLGNTVVMTTDQIRAATSLGLVVLGFQQFQPGLSLAAFGAPECFQNAGIQSTAIFLPTGTSGTVSLAIPNNQALAGRHVYSQSLTLTPGLNALGVLTSNGLDLLLNPQ